MMFGHYCDLWHHIECEKISKEVYKFLMKEEAKTIHWYCRKCNVIAGKIIPHISKLEKYQDTLEKRLESLERVSSDKIDNLQTEVDGLKRKVMDIEKMKMTFCDEMKDDVCRSCRDMVKEEVKKVYEVNPESGNKQVIIDKSVSLIQERLDRRNNLILYNVSEEVVKGKDLSIRAEKIKLDSMIFKDLCAEIGVKCCDDDVIDIKRLGKYTGGSSKPRPILVTVGWERKERVMRNVGKLKNCGNDLLRNIGISHDMNMEERKRNNELRKEVYTGKEHKGTRHRKFLWGERAPMEKNHCMPEEDDNTKSATKEEGQPGASEQQMGSQATSEHNNTTLSVAEKLKILFSNMDVESCELKNRIKGMKNYPHIIAVQEVKPQNIRYERDLAEYNIEGYELMGRGIIIYI